jgi:hypothetical protein
MPAASEPKPRSPSKGNGDAVCGRLPAALFWAVCVLSVAAAAPVWSALAAFWSAFWPAAAAFWFEFSVPLTALLPVAEGLFSAAAPLDGFELLWSLGLAGWAEPALLDELLWVVVVEVADCWLVVSVPLGEALGVLEAAPAGWFWFCCMAAWSLGFVVAFWLEAEPAWVVAPWGAAAAELDGLAWLACAASPVAPVGPGLAAPLLLLQESAMCCTELTARELPAPLLEEAVPELGLAAPEVPVADELLLVPVMLTSCPTCCCSWLVSPESV